MSIRSSSYTVTEDVLLCQVYLDISQDPITGRYQSQDQFWSRVEEAYNNNKQENWAPRYKRSVQSRMTIITSEVKKLNGCVRQIESMNPSGASNQDILDRAKELFMQDPKYKRGFRFDHVWNIVKEYEKFKDNNTNRVRVPRSDSDNFNSSQSDNPTLDSNQSASPSISSFTLNLDDEEIGGTSSQRPIGVKKAKLKRKNDEHISAVVTSNMQLVEMLKKTTSDRQRQMEIQMARAQNEAKKLALKEAKHDNKILLTDLNSIVDPAVREYIRVQQTIILQKRAREQGPSSTTNDFGEFFNNIGGSGADLPDY